MVRLALRIAANAAAIWVAAWLIDGVEVADGIGSILLVAVIFGIVNAIIRPIAKFVTFPVTLATLGLFTLVINAAMLWLTSQVTDSLTVDWFWPAFLGALVVSVVSAVLSIFVPDDDDD